MQAFAQTNLQLFNQLRKQGYGAADLQAVGAAYDLMIALMTGRFRASGKTFIAHLVGTASILASLRAACPVVAAGLLHAVYVAGDFGDGQFGVSEAKRQRVREVAGAQVEEYVCRYAALPWTDQAIRSLTAALDGMAASERVVILMRLANELEEFLDLGILYCGDDKRYQVAGGPRQRLLTSLAEKLGYPTLAADLNQAFEETAAAVIPPELRRAAPLNSSFLLAPLSYQRLKDALARRLAAPGNPGSTQP